VAHCYNLPLVWAAAMGACQFVVDLATPLGALEIGDGAKVHINEQIPEGA